MGKLYGGICFLSRVADSWDSTLIKKNALWSFLGLFLPVLKNSFNK